MAMTKQLWSLNALATELSRDRRTIAKALNRVVPDGELSGEKAWFMTTALRALDRPKPQLPGHQEDDFTSLLLGRVKNWKQLYFRKELLALSVDETAACSDVRRADVLNWLRAGMPYLVEGNWATGEGFRIPVRWAMDWQVLVSGYAAHSGQERLSKELGLA